MEEIDKEKSRKLDFKVRNILNEAEKVLDGELQDPANTIMSADEVENRTNEILARMDEKGISNKKLRRNVEKVKRNAVPKIREYEEKIAIAGERNSYSKTDPDATFMRMKEDAMNNGQTKSWYNVQISTFNQFITNYGIFWNSNDQGTLIPYLDSFVTRYGVQSKEVCADSGYGSEMNYEYLFTNEITPYVKYNMFHAEMKPSRKNNPFLSENMYYNADKDFYVYPMGQHLDFVYETKETSDLVYTSTKSVYRAKDCSHCPLREMCYKGKVNIRTIEVNHRNNHLRAKARELLTSEEGVKHRSKRPIEPEAVFG